MIGWCEYASKTGTQKLIRSNAKIYIVLSYLTLTIWFPVSVILDGPSYSPPPRKSLRTGNHDWWTDALVERAYTGSQANKDSGVMGWFLLSYTRWWFQTCFIYTPIWGRSPILTNIFQRGWLKPPTSIWWCGCGLGSLLLICWSFQKWSLKFNGTFLAWEDWLSKWPMVRKATKKWWHDGLGWRLWFFFKGCSKMSFDDFGIRGTHHCFRGWFRLVKYANWMIH